MQLSKNHRRLEAESGVTPARQPGRLRFLRRYAAFFFVGAVLAAAQQAGQQSGQQTNGSTPAKDTSPDRAWSSSQLAVPMPENGKQNFDAANAERRKQIADDTAKLLKLATDLKLEVDKTNKDTLSLNVIRKADEIEKLAHGVKEKMKLTAGPN